MADLMNVPRGQEWWTGPVGRAVHAEDWAWLAGWLHGQFGACVTPEAVRGWFDADRATAPHTSQADRFGWSDGSWRVWFKNRLVAANALPCPAHAAPLRINLLVPLHVGFLSLFETPEELAILRRDPTPVPGGPSTPGISRDNHFPAPVDRVAARVAPGTGPQENP